MTEVNKIESINKGGYLAKHRKIVLIVVAAVAAVGGYLVGDQDLVTAVTEIINAVTSTPAVAQ